MGYYYQGDGARFIFNGDLSGGVTITDQRTQQTMEVLGQDLLAFVAEVVRMRKIAAIEQASTETLLGLPERAS